MYFSSTWTKRTAFEGLGKALQLNGTTVLHVIRHCCIH